MSELHVIPRGDLVDHETSEDCVCGPDPKFVDGEGIVFTHHSLDGREQNKETA